MRCSTCRFDVEEKEAMKREELKALRSLRKEADDLEDRICERIDMRRPHTVGDTTGDYSTGHKRIITISGEADPYSDRLICRWKEKREEVERQIERLEQWIDEIEDPTARTIVRMYFADGKSQQEIADELYIERSTISKMITRTCDESHKSQN